MTENADGVVGVATVSSSAAILVSAWRRSCSVRSSARSSWCVRGARRPKAKIARKRRWGWI